MAASSQADFDGINVEMLKKLPPQYTEIIAELFEQSLTNGTFPNSWKRAVRVPLTKVKNLTALTDTCPISLLPELSKILERIVLDQLSSYLERNKLLDEHQSGFRKGHSIQTALIKVCDDMRLAIDQGKIIGLVFFDFSKAFDSVPHALLLKKLRQLGSTYTPLKWFYSYICDRLQAVVDENGDYSEWLHTGAGVPQGRIVGPLLFSIFINDLKSVLSSAKDIIFADDLQLYYSFSPSELDEGIKTISKDCCAITNWASENGLALNANKCMAMILGSSIYTSRLDLHSIPKITINGRPLPYEMEMKSLGIWSSPNLTQKKQVSLILQRIQGSLRTLKFYARALSRDLKKQLVETMIFPHFDNAGVVYNSVDKTRNTKL